MKLNNEELITVKGGASNLSGTLINSILRVCSFVFDLGKSVGSGIRYKISGYKC